MQQKIEEELQEEELLEDLFHNQQINGLAQGKMSQNSSNATDSKMATTGKPAWSVNNKRQGAAQDGFQSTEKRNDLIGLQLSVFDNPAKKPIMKPAVPPVIIPPQWIIQENFVDYGRGDSMIFKNIEKVMGVQQSAGRDYVLSKE